MSIRLKLTGSVKAIEKKVTAAIADHINKTVNKNTQKVINSLKKSIKGWVLAQPEIDSLKQNGVQNTLAAMFGLGAGEGDAAAAAIANAVADAISIKVEKIKNDLSGSIYFGFQSKTFANLLALPQGHNLTKNGDDLHWLDWLLTKGDTVVVLGYYYDPSTGGISGGGTMKKGGSFRVPPQFSGNVDNNFITRAFVGKEKEVATIIKELLS